MKLQLGTFLLSTLCWGTLLTQPLQAQPENTPSSQESVRVSSYSAQELDALLKPIALYPDALLAQVLPAAAFPAQIQAAAEFLKEHPEGEIDAQPWEDSVKAVAHYPEVLQQMAQDMDWTEALGQAASQQMSEVTSSLQRLRNQAYRAGNLQSNEQQIVSTEQGIITVQPASPQTLYLPNYDSSLVYGTQSIGWAAPLVTFGLGYACGSWLTYGYDWYGRGCYRYPRGLYYGSAHCPNYSSITYVHNAYNPGNCNTWRAPLGNNTYTYNHCYRPGTQWSRQPGCFRQNAWAQQAQNGFLPGNFSHFSRPNFNSNFSRGNSHFNHFSRPNFNSSFSRGNSNFNHFSRPNFNSNFSRGNSHFNHFSRPNFNSSFSRGNSNFNHFSRPNFNSNFSRGNSHFNHFSRPNFNSNFSRGNSNFNHFSRPNFNSNFSRGAGNFSRGNFMGGGRHGRCR